MKCDVLLDQIKEELDKLTGGSYKVTAEIPKEFEHLIPGTVRNFWQLPGNLQRLFRLARLVQGRAGNFVFQSSHGTQQIKLYEPEKYGNDRNTPLRIRSRTIVHLAAQEPPEKRKDKIRELYRIYPYHLLKDEPINLRLKNFYFERSIMEGDLIRILQASDPDNPNPATDDFYTEKEYFQRRTIEFAYQGDDEQHFYALNTRNNGLSNVLHFIWQDNLIT